MEKNLKKSKKRIIYIYHFSVHLKHCKSPILQKKKKEKKRKTKVVDKLYQIYMM